MVKLTNKQEAFCQAIADGMTQADAYRRAYNAGAMKPETIQSKACILVKDGKVGARIESLKLAIANKALWTREDSVQALKNIAGGGEARANEIVSAIKELNAMHGFNAPTKIDLTGSIKINVNFD